MQAGARRGVHGPAAHVRQGYAALDGGQRGLRGGERGGSAAQCGRVKSCVHFFNAGARQPGPCYPYE
jgi:hypothetical protein